MAYEWLNAVSLDEIGKGIAKELSGGSMATDMMNAQQLAGFGIEKLLGGGVPVTVTVALDNGYLVVFVPKKHHSSPELPDSDELSFGIGVMAPQQLRPMGRPMVGRPVQMQQQAPPPMPPDEIEKRRRAFKDRWREERKKSIEHEPRVRVYPTLSLAMADIESFMKNGVPPNVTVSDEDLAGGGAYAVMA